MFKNRIYLKDECIGSPLSARCEVIEFTENGTCCGCVCALSGLVMLKNVKKDIGNYKYMKHVWIKIWYLKRLEIWDIWLLKLCELGPSVGLVPENPIMAEFNTEGDVKPDDRDVGPFNEELLCCIKPLFCNNGLYWFPWSCIQRDLSKLKKNEWIIKKLLRNSNSDQRFKINYLCIYD